MSMNEFEKQIWAAAYAAEYVRSRDVCNQLHSQRPQGYMSPEEAGIEYDAARIAAEAVKKFRKLKECEDGPYYLLEKGF